MPFINEIIMTEDNGSPCFKTIVTSKKFLHNVRRFNIRLHRTINIFNYIRHYTANSRINQFQLFVYQVDEYVRVFRFL